jgi:hypothetical protein
VPEVWCFAPHVNLSASFWDILEKLACQLIAVPNDGISHMAVAFPNEGGATPSGYCIEADADGVVRNVARDDVLQFCNDGSRILGYRFTPPLTADQIAKGDAFLDGIIGDPYGFLDLIRRGIEVAVADLGVVLGGPVSAIIKAVATIDWQKALGIRAWICYRVVAGWLAAMGFAVGNEAEWGPMQLIDMQAHQFFGPEVDVATAELPEIES